MCSIAPASPGPPSTSTSRTRKPASSPLSTPPRRACASASRRRRGDGEGWRQRLRLSLEELLRFVAEDPDAAMSLIVDARAACPPALERRDELLDHFSSCLDTQVRAEADPANAPSAIAAAGIVGGIEALLYARLNRGEADDVQSLLPSLMYFAVLPYEGHEVASEELALSVG